MNPWAFIVIAVGILVIIIGIKGTQHHVASALTGKTTTASQSATSSIPSTGTIVA